MRTGQAQNGCTPVKTTFEAQHKDLTLSSCGVGGTRAGGGRWSAAGTGGGAEAITASTVGVVVLTVGGGLGSKCTDTFFLIL